jgi:hypothetical protein
VLYYTEVADIGGALTIAPRNGKAVHLSVPAGGFVIYK